MPFEPDLDNARAGKRTGFTEAPHTKPADLPSRLLLSALHQEIRMSANPKFISAAARVDAAAVAPLPNSRKIYVTGSQPDIRMPMRQITPADSPTAFARHPHTPI